MSTPPSEPRALDDGGYRIAAVASLTGIAAATIRIWEQRYAVVQPARSGGNLRLYTRADIERLTLLKAAVDAGFAISTVAALSDEQLHERLRSGPRSSKPLPPRAVMVDGDGLASTLAVAWRGRMDIRLCPVATTFDATEPDALKVDVLVVDIPSLRGLALDRVRQLRAASRPTLTVITYGIGGRKMLESLDREGIIALPAPVDPRHLARLCSLDVGSANRAVDAMLGMQHGSAVRRLDDAFLDAVSRLPTSILCECPNHLADLLIRLNAFEAYSRHCEDTDSDDALLHSLMARSAVQCRALLEETLQRVMEHAGIRAPDPALPTVVP